MALRSESLVYLVSVSFDRVLRSNSWLLSLDKKSCRVVTQPSSLPQVEGAGVERAAVYN